MTPGEGPSAHRTDPIEQPPDVRFWLRAEGLAAFAAGIWLFGSFDGWWPAVIPLLLIPDLSMLGYLRGPRIGALAYNLAHNWAVALAIAGIGVATDVHVVVLAGAVLIAHVGVDRALGYGLKFPTSFQDTHLGRIGRRN